MEHSGTPPGPGDARTVDELGERLRALRAWSGLSYREIHRRVVRARRERGEPVQPSLDSVHRCLRPGRRRLDPELITDVAAAMLGDRVSAEDWRQAHRTVTAWAVDSELVSVERGLPDDQPRFAGRAAELTSLDRALGGPGAAVLVVEGMAGVGKTALAVRGAHRLMSSGRFDDVFTADLRGHHPDRPPADSGAVLDALLRLLGCPPHQLHTLDLDGKTDRYRRLLTGRRNLVLLDDAHSREQLRPLLVPAGDSRILVTTRNRLAGLPSLTLGVLTETESIELLCAAGVPVDDDRTAAAGIAAQVDHLPLALALVAGRITATPRWSLDDHLRRLVDLRRYAALDEGVRTSFELTYRELRPESRRLLRLLGIRPGRDGDLFACAALLDRDAGETERCLAELVGAHAVRQRSAGRYELHDLMRAFAARRALDEESPSARHDAVDRLLGHHQVVAELAMHRYSPADQDPPREQPSAGTVPDLADRTAATAWLDAERGNLIAGALHSAGRAGELSRILHRYLDQAGHYQDALVLHEFAARHCDDDAAVDALLRYAVACMRIGRLARAREIYLETLPRLHERGDLVAETKGWTNLGIICRRMGRYDEAIEIYHRSIAAYEAADERVQHGRTQGNLGYVYVLCGRWREGAEHLWAAVTTARAEGDRAGEAVALGNLGIAAQNRGRHLEVLELQKQVIAALREIGDRANEGMAYNLRGTAFASLGRYREAVAEHERALAIAREVGDPDGEVDALNGGADALRRLGEPAEAVEWAGTALRIATDTGNDPQQAASHERLADSHSAAGDEDAATRHWAAALALFRALGRPEAERVAARLT